MDKGWVSLSELHATRTRILLLLQRLTSTNRSSRMCPFFFDKSNVSFVVSEVEIVEGVGEREQSQRRWMTRDSNRAYPRYHLKLLIENQQHTTVVRKGRAVLQQRGRKANYSCTDHKQDHSWKDVFWEIPLDGRCFLTERHYSWWCGHVLCLGTIDTSNKYV